MKKIKEIYLPSKNLGIVSIAAAGGRIAGMANGSFTSPWLYLGILLILLAFYFASDIKNE